MKYSIAQLNEESGLYTEVAEYTLEEIREMAESGRLSKTDLVYAEGFSDWEELGSLNLSEFQKLPEFIPSGQKPSLITVPPPIPPSNIIRVIRKGETIGPYSRDLAKEYFAIGWLLSTDWGWHDGMDEWKPLNEVLGIVVSPPAEPPKPSSKLPPVIGEPGNHDAPDPNKTTPTDWRYETKEISTFKGILAMSSKKIQLHYIERLGDRLIVCTRDGKREDFIFGQFEATTYIGQEDLRWFFIKDTLNPKREKRFQEIYLATPTKILKAKGWWDEIATKVGFKDDPLTKYLAKAAGCLSWFT